MNIFEKFKMAAQTKKIALNLNQLKMIKISGTLNYVNLPVLRFIVENHF
jgi:hypothetical protein